MKNLKIIVFVITTILFVACSSSDNNDAPSKVAVIGSIDTNVLLSLSGNDATALVTLNGESAATQTTELAIGGEVSYKVNTASANVEIVILDFFFTSGNREFWTNNIQVNVNTQTSPSVATLTVLDGAAVGDEAKFGFTFALKTNGVLDLNTTYIVDPKIRVRS